MEVEEKKVIVFAIKSTAFDEEVLVMAEDVTEAIEKFNKYYDNDYNVRYHSKIESVTPRFNVDCLV